MENKTRLPSRDLNPKRELKLILPTPDILHQIDGYSALNLLHDHQYVIPYQSKKDFERSHSKWAGQLFQIQLENVSDYSHGLSSYRQELMQWLAYNNKGAEYEEHYKAMLNSNSTPYRLFDSLADLGVHDPDRYFRLLDDATEIVPKNSYTFNTSLEQIATAHPDQTLAYLNSREMDDKHHARQKAFAQLARISEDPWKSIESFITSDDRDQRTGGLECLKTMVINSIKSGQSLAQLFELEARTITLKEAEREAFHAHWQDPQRTERLRNLHEALWAFEEVTDLCKVVQVCLDQTPIPELSSASIKNQHFIGGVLLELGRYDLYETIVPDTATHTSEHQFINSINTEIQNTSDTDRQQELITIRDRVYQKCVEHAFEEDSGYLSFLHDLREAKEQGSEAKKTAALVGLYVLTNAKDAVGAEKGLEIAQRIAKANLATLPEIFRHQPDVFEESLSTHPEVFLQATENIEMPEGHRVTKDDLANKRAEAKWRILYKTNPSQFHRDIAQTLGNVSDWHEMAGALASLDLVLSEDLPTATNFLHNNLPGLMENLEHSRKRYIEAGGEEDKNYIALGEARSICILSLEKAVLKTPKSQRAQLALFILAEAQTQDYKYRIDVDLLHSLGSLTKEELIAIIPQVHQIETSRSLSQWEKSNPMLLVGPETVRLLESLAILDPVTALKFFDEYKPGNWQKSRGLEEIVLYSLISLPDNREVQKFESETHRLLDSKKLVGWEPFAAVCVGLMGEQADQGIKFLTDLSSKLRLINGSLSTEKQTASVEAFLYNNQQSLAKLMLLTPNYAHAQSLMVEIASQHGFTRLSDRLNLMDSFDLQDVIKSRELIATLKPGEITQSLLANITGLHAAFVAIGHKEEFYRLAANYPDAKKLIDGLGKGLLEIFAKSTGLDISDLPDNALQAWKSDYLPRLFEAVQQLGDIDHTFFTTILKSTMRGEFLEMIDFQREFDLTAYSPQEQAILRQIKNHNRLTEKRFSDRNLDLKVFSQGQERKVVQVVTAQDQIAKAYEQVAGQLQQMLFEATKYSDLSDMAEKVNALELNLGSRVNELLGFLRQQEGVISKDEFFQETEVLLRKILGRGKQSTGALIGSDTAGQIKSDKDFMKIFKWSEGHVIDIVASGDSIDTRLTYLDDKLREAQSMDFAQQSEITTAREQVMRLRSLVQAGLVAGYSQEKLSRPDLSTPVKEIVSVMGNVTRRLEDESKTLKDVNTDPAKLESLKLLQDHIGGKLEEFQDLAKIGRTASTREFNLTLRRWQRNPGHDIFQGNYTSCCVAIDSFNSFAMMRYLTGRDVELTEIIDNSSGDTVGQSYEFIGESRKGGLSYHVDNIELTPEVQAISGLIRNNIFAMAQETAEAMKLSGDKPGIAEVVMGTSYNDVDISDLVKRHEIIRKLGGPMLGLRQYVDTFVVHIPGSLDQVLSPGAYHNISVAKVADLESAPEKPASPQVNISQSSPNDWSEITTQILELENDTFGITADSAETLAGQFSDPNSIAIVARNAQGKIIGYTMGINHEPIEVDGTSYPTIYISSAAVDYDYQTSGVNSAMEKQLIDEARNRGYALVAIHAMADSGYAQRIITRAEKQGLLVEPKSLDAAETNDYYGRPQFYIVTRIPN